MKEIQPYPRSESELLRDLQAFLNDQFKLWIQTQEMEQEKRKRLNPVQKRIRTILRGFVK